MDTSPESLIDPRHFGSEHSVGGGGGGQFVPPDFLSLPRIKFPLENWATWRL